MVDVYGFHVGKDTIPMDPLFFFSNKKVGLLSRPIESDDGEAFLWEVGSQVLAKRDAEKSETVVLGSESRDSTCLWVASFFEISAVG